MQFIGKPPTELIEEAEKNKKVFELEKKDLWLYFGLCRTFGGFIVVILLWTDKFIEKIGKNYNFVKSKLPCFLRVFIGDLDYMICIISSV